MNIKPQLFFWRAVFAVTAILMVAGLIQLAQTANSFGVQVIYSRWVYLFVTISTAIVIDLALLGVSWTHWQASLLGRLEAVARLDKWWRIIAGFVFIALPFTISIAILHPYIGTYYFPGFFSRLALFWCLALTGMFCVRIIWKDLSWLAAVGISVVILAVLYRMMVIFSVVTDYPFSRGWSEVSRYYGASLFFSQHLYGGKFPLPVMDPAWHLLLTLPFMFGNLPLWSHRLWEALLQVGLTSALSRAVVQRWNLRSGLHVWLATGWAFLFLLQGPVHIHLLACAFIVMWGVKPRKFWRTTLVVILASVWAGISRINWYPVPGLFAAVLFMLEDPFKVTSPRLRYFWKPVFWFTLGLVAAFASQFTYVLVSANTNQPGGAFTSLSSDLLWYRLFPSTTNPVGILLSAFIFSLPLLALIIFSLHRRHGSFHPMRLTGIFSVFLVLFFGGLVVSIKIGGGSDLHNMDAYFILLMLVSGYFYFDRITPETGRVHAPVSYPPVVTFLAIFFPVCVAIQLVNPVFSWDRAQANQKLATIRSQAEAVERNGGEVLFISQRHLLALKVVDVPLVPEYEQDSLMEMVMSHNRAYLDRFQADMQAQRFALIVAWEQNISYYGESRSFGEENDMWVEEVSIPLLCDYRPIYQPSDFGIVLFVPRDQPCK